MKGLSRDSATAKFLILLGLALVFLLAGKFFHVEKASVQELLRGFPAAVSGAAFVILYVTVTFFVRLGPKDIFRIAAALVYGPYLSTLFVFAGEMINVAILFSLSRRLGRGYVESRLKGNMQKVDEALTQSGDWAIFLMRLTPIVPFRFLDLGFGLTRISLRKYFALSALGSPLRIFFLQFLLCLGFDTVADPRKFTDYLLDNPTVFQIGLAYLILSALTLVLLKKKARRP